MLADLCEHAGTGYARANAFKIKEDLSRKRKENAAKDKTHKASYKKKRTKAALNQEYRNQLLNL